MAGEVMRTSLPSRQDLAGVRAQDAVDDIHQRRLAGAVFAGQRMDLAAAQFEAHAAQRADRVRKTCVRSVISRIVSSAAGGMAWLRSPKMCYVRTPAPPMTRRGCRVRSAAQLGSRPSMYLFRSKELAFSLVMTANPLSTKGICIGL